MPAGRRRSSRPGTARSRPAPPAWGRLRRATERDLEVLVRHRHRMFSDIGRRTEREITAHDRVYRAWARRGLRDRQFFAFVVEASDGRVVGSGAVWLQPQQPRPGWLARPTLPYILSMYTEPDARGRGVATRLVTEMVRWATDRGYPRIFLHASTMGRPVYARFGFEEGNEMRLELPDRARGRR